MNPSSRSVDLVMDYLEHGNLLDYAKAHRLGQIFSSLGSFEWSLIVVVDDKTLQSLHFQVLDIIEVCRFAEPARHLA